MFASLAVWPTLLEWVYASQRRNAKLLEILNHLKIGLGSDNLKQYEVDRDGWIHKDGRLYRCGWT